MAAVWYDSLGRKVDLDNIDKRYALNIYTMYVMRQALRFGMGPKDLVHDELAQKLREVMMTGREPNESDRARAAEYDALNAKNRKPFRSSAEAYRDVSCVSYGLRTPEQIEEYLHCVDKYGDAR